MNIMRRRVTRRGAVRQPTGGRRRIGRGPVRSRPRRSSQGPRGIGAAAQKKALQRIVGAKKTTKRRSNATSEQNAKLKQAGLSELFKRKRAGQRPARPTQRLTAQQRSRLAAQRAAKARGRGSRRINQANLRMSRARRR